ncbi:hypothetical protein E2C01_023579 [Portunus trituberculatus]|uniref:Uncharacterized protein n=1 Tax=Portunus trituberculatus TaxID=210409 RepID=A0A5B7EAD2_PORTR|nr:hypothetical protein [Portunus trituberculatus]
MRARQVVAHIDVTSSFGTQMRIEKRGNRKGATVSCLRQLCFGKKKKMRFSRGEGVFYRLKTRPKIANVAEVNGEISERGCQGIYGRYRASSPTWGHLWSPPSGGL